MLSPKEDLIELERAPIRRDFTRVLLTSNCSFYNPIKLCRPKEDENLKSLSKSRPYQVAESYPRKNRKFPLWRLPHAVRDRFIELLAPLTLYHFSKTSKYLYRECLNLRGLEFKKLVIPGALLLQANKPDKLRLDALAGMRIGRIPHSIANRAALVKCQVCLGQLVASYSVYCQDPGQFGFVKKYKKLTLVFDKGPFDAEFGPVCEALFHQAVEHVFLDLREVALVPEEAAVENGISMAKLSQLLDRCRNVKSLVLTLASPQQPQDAFLNTPQVPFSSLKALLEAWGAENPNLDIFFLRFKQHLFQLQVIPHSRRRELKRCIQRRGKWCLSQKTDVDASLYKPFATSGIKLEYLGLTPRQKYGYYDDVIATPMKSNTLCRGVVWGLEKSFPQVLDHIENFIF